MFYIICFNFYIIKINFCFNVDIFGKEVSDSNKSTREY
jgi:hypothetical protein